MPDYSYVHPEFVKYRKIALSLVAKALNHLFSSVYLLHGEVTDEGFYYDCILDQPPPGNLAELLEVEIAATIRRCSEYRLVPMMGKGCIELFNSRKQPFLSELIFGQENTLLSMFESEGFYHFCDIDSEEEIELSEVVKGMKVLAISKGSYFHEEEGQMPTTRIVGTAFTNRAELKQFLKKFDKHLKFSSSTKPHLYISHRYDDEMVSLHWLPHGEKLRNKIKEVWFQLLQPSQHQIVSTSSFGVKPADAFAISYHDQLYYLTNSKKEQHDQLFLADHYQNSAHFRIGTHYHFVEWSKYFIPAKIAQSPLLNLIDPAEISLYYLPEIERDLITFYSSNHEMMRSAIYFLQLILKMIKIFQLEGEWFISCPDSARKAGKKEINDRNEIISSFKEGLDSAHLPYSVIEREGQSEVAIEFCLIDGLGRRWIFSSIEWFNGAGSRTNKNSSSVEKRQRLSVTLIYSIERLIGWLLEYHKGFLPVWLAPTAIKIIPLSEKDFDYAKALMQECSSKGLSVEIDEQIDLALATRIYANEQQKIPYLLIVGEKERKKERVTVRQMIPGKDLFSREMVSLEVFLKEITLK